MRMRGSISAQSQWRRTLPKGLLPSCSRNAHRQSRPPATCVVAFTIATTRYRSTRMNWDLRHRKSSLVIRLLLAAWITVVVVVLCATGHWWGLVFVAPLLLDLYLLRRILAAGSSR